VERIPEGRAPEPRQIDIGGNTLPAFLIGLVVGYFAHGLLVQTPQLIVILIARDGDTAMLLTVAISGAIAAVMWVLGGRLGRGVAVSASFIAGVAASAAVGLGVHVVRYGTTDPWATLQTLLHLSSFAALAGAFFFARRQAARG